MKKILAYLFMICGIAAVFFDGILPSCAIFVLEIIGYISMPFFAQALAEGFFLASNTYKYFLRIAFTAYLSQAVLLLVYLLWNKSPQPARLNIVFTWLIAFLILYGVELLVSLPRDRVASLNLLEPNQTSHSTRYGIVISSTEANNLPKGMKVPAWPRTTLHALAIVLFAVCMTLLTFLPLTMSLMSVMCTLIFYFLHRWKIDNRVLVATVFYSAFAACYTYMYFRMTGTVTWQAFSLIGFLLCLLLPSRKRKRPKIFYRSLYLLYPVTIGLCAITAYLVS
ncbi:MAG: hypothetical protein IK020_03210 [Clostridiales bacterium]|nr:hypothetical protein [Clostridiales bacterium]